MSQKHHSIVNDYKKAKELMASSAYSEAMPIFLRLSIESKDNHVYKDASFLYANAAVRAGKYDEALQMLKQIEIKYPDFFIDEIKYLTSISYFYAKEYDKGLLVSKKIGSTKLKDEVKNAKHYFVSLYKDTDKLYDLYLRNQDDEVVAKILFDKLLLKQPKNERDRGVLSELQAKFGFEIPKGLEPNASIKYIGLLLPYQTLGAQSINNTIFYDFHSGFLMGIDSLNKENEKIKLLYYSIEKDSTQLMSFLNSEDFGKLDLIIGPAYSNLSNIVYEYSNLNNATPVINPFSNYVGAKGEKGNFFYLNPTVETIGSASAEMSLKQFFPKNSIVFYSPNAKDSIAAYSFKARYEKGKGKVLFMKSLAKNNAAALQKVVNEKNRDSVGVVMAFTSDQMAATNIITAMEVANCKAPIVSSRDWLEFRFLTLKKIQSHDIHFIFPNYYSHHNDTIQKFDNKYFNRYNLYPTEYSYLGYDAAMYLGDMLSKYGEDFGDKLKDSQLWNLGLLQGFDYKGANNNQVVQFVRFKENELVPIIEYK